VDEKGLHLGGITIPKQILPLPPSTGTNQKQEEGRKAQREREEIQRQEEARERREGQKESIEATRKRKDEERARERGGG
jgi:hypothetical protein